MRARRFLLLNPALVLALLVCLVLAGRGFPPDDLPPMDLERVFEVRGWLASSPLHRLDSIELEVIPLEVLQGGARIPYAYRLQVLVRHSGEQGSAASGLSFGDLVRLRAFLSEPPYSAIPGVADYRWILRLRGIRHQVRLKSLQQVERIGAHPPTRPLRPIFRYVEGFEDFCRQHFSPQGSGLLLGVSLGRRPAWDGTQRSRLERLGILHLFVVSGFHISLLVALLHRLLRPLGRFGILISLLGMWTYVLLTGAGIPTVRAALMTSLFYLLLVSGLRRQMLNALGLSALAVLAWRPESLFSAGFQFSYLALLAIGVMVLPQLDRISGFSQGIRDFGSKVVLVERDAATRLRRRIRFALEERLEFAPRLCSPLLQLVGRLTRFALPLAWTSLAIQLATLPLTLHFSNLWIWTQAASNLLLAPVLSLLLPSGLVLLGLYRTPLGWLLAQLLNAYLKAVEGLLKSLEGWALSNFLPHPKVWEVALYFGLLALLLLAFRNGRRYLCLPLPALILWILVHRTAPQQGRLQLTMLDVGQAEAMHLTYPNGTQALVDTGGRYGPPRAGDDFVGRRLTARYLWHQRVRRLRFVLLSHPHSDHIQGLGFIRRHFDLGRVLYFDPPGQAMGSQGRQLVRGDRFWIGAVEHRVLHPPLRTAGSLSVNDRSLVVLLRYRNFSMLLTGDIERPSERLLLPGIDPVTLLKIPHHGGKTSSSRRLLERLRPQVALISAGRRNPFGHPSAQTLERLRRSGIPSFSTTKWGTLRIQSDGHRWQLLHYSTKHRSFVLLAEAGRGGGETAEFAERRRGGR